MAESERARDTEGAGGDDPDRVLAVADGPEVEDVVQGSRFLGQVFAVSEEGTGVERLESVRARYPDATHHCWAWRLGPPERARERCDDDGEPGRTAGPPILQALVSAGVSDALVVVTRYFGGTKLGKGGLVRAYGAAARRALAEAPRRTSWRRVELVVSCEYADLGAVEACLSRAGDAVFAAHRVFEESPRFEVVIKQSRAAGLRDAVVEATQGRAVVGEVARE